MKLETVMPWHERKAFMKAVRMKGANFPLLTLLISPGLENDYVVAVLESHSPQVFQDHAHKLLGHFKSKRAAFKACNEYAREWVAGQIEKCKCKEIEVIPHHWAQWAGFGGDESGDL